MEAISTLKGGLLGCLHLAADVAPFKAELHSFISQQLRIAAAHPLPMGGGPSFTNYRSRWDLDSLLPILLAATEIEWLVGACISAALILSS